VRSLVEHEARFSGGTDPTLLVLACGAIAREVLAVVELNEWTHVEVRCLPAQLHNTPRAIAGAVDEKLSELSADFDRVFVAYADCGTAGELDRVLARHAAERLPGAHCYAFFAGVDAWTAMHDSEPGTYYLTDFLARHFEALVVAPLGLDRHPDLKGEIFRNYRKLVYLAQSDDPQLDASARAAAGLLGLEYERRATGLGELRPALERFEAVARDA
jgi:hypothetical protein